MQNLSMFLLAAALLTGGALIVAPPASATSHLRASRTPADRRAGKQYGQQYAAQTAEQYGYGTPTYNSQIENEYNYAENERTDPNSPQSPDFWSGVELGLYSN